MGSGSLAGEKKDASSGGGVNFSFICFKILSFKCMSETLAYHSRILGWGDQKFWFSKPRMEGSTLSDPEFSFEAFSSKILLLSSVLRKCSKEES